MNRRDEVKAATQEVLDQIRPRWIHTNARRPLLMSRWSIQEEGELLRYRRSWSQ